MIGFGFTRRDEMPLFLPLVKMKVKDLCYIAGDRIIRIANPIPLFIKLNLAEKSREVKLIEQGQQNG